VNSSSEVQYWNAVYDSCTWRRLASELVSAAEAIEPKLADFWAGVRRGEWNDAQVAVYFMLCAYALENLMKAKLVEKEISAKKASSAISKLPSHLMGHDLVDLAKRCGKDKLAEEYASILKRLSRSAVWYGRYPVPVTATAFKSIDVSPSGQAIILTEYSSNDRDKVKHLLQEFGFQVK